MNQGGIPDAVGFLVFFAAFLFSKEAAAVLGPYAVIIICAAVGGGFSVGRREKTTRLSACWYYLKVVLLAVMLTASIALGIAQWWPALLPRITVAPIALMIGFVGDAWPAMLARVLRFLTGFLDRKGPVE